MLIGGVSFGDQELKLDRGVDVLIATPGRLLDHFERGKLLLTGVQIMVVDEADRMLDMGFIPDIERIFKLTPAAKQTLFLATMPPEITRLTQQFLRNPIRIEVSRQASTAENILQHVVRIPSTDPKAKRLALRALISRETVRTHCSQPQVRSRHRRQVIAHAWFRRRADPRRPRPATRTWILGFLP
ncbi:MAG: DEAD/DEAH box helicase [Paludibaculum sp.]